MSVQKRPATRQIQPIGFSGRLEAIRAPTTVKARKGARINRLPMAPPEPQSLEGCAAGAVTYKDKIVSMAPATNMATDSPASDQASQEAARGLTPATPYADPCRRRDATTARRGRAASSPSPPLRVRRSAPPG